MMLEELLSQSSMSVWPLGIVNCISQIFCATLVYEESYNYSYLTTQSHNAL